MGELTKVDITTDAAVTDGWTPSFVKVLSDPSVTVQKYNFGVCSVVQQ